MNETKDKKEIIEDIIHNLLLSVSDKFGIPDTEEAINQILALFDLSNVGIEVDCSCREGKIYPYPEVTIKERDLSLQPIDFSNGITCPKCQGIGKITRPTTMAELIKIIETDIKEGRIFRLKSGGILKVKE